MTKFVRLAALAAAATLGRDAGRCRRSRVVASPAPQARVNIVKPLTLARDRDLVFGTVVVYGDDTVSIDQAGVVTCGTAGQR